MDAESLRKIFKTLNLTGTNAILMKITRIMYLHKSVNRKAVRAINSLPCIAQLVKFLYKYYEKPPKIGPK